MDKNCYAKKRPCLYISVTKDKYRLPLCVADTPEELAEMCGVNLSTVSRGLKLFVKQERERKKPSSKYEIVRF